MNEYRCTRNHPYRDSNCPGNLDETARQGHYVRGESKIHAFCKMCESFPDPEDIKAGFTITFWKKLPW